MITRRNNLGDRYVYDDDENLVAVHGKFCTGCSATSGVCGRLTEKMLPIFNRLRQPVTKQYVNASAITTYCHDCDEVTLVEATDNGLFGSDASWCASCESSDIIQRTVAGTLVVESEWVEDVSAEMQSISEAV